MVVDNLPVVTVDYLTLSMVNFVNGNWLIVGNVWKLNDPKKGMYDSQGINGRP